MYKLLIAALAIFPAAGQQRVAFHYAENFGSGQASGWTSYPPVQDVAYDPSLTPLPRRGGGFSMRRIVRPTADGPLSVGFIRRMSFVATLALRLSFKAGLEPAGTPADVEVGLAARSGVLYRARSASGPVSLAAADFRLKDGEQIEAVYVVANMARASAAVEYTVRLDDVSLDAVRPRRGQPPVPLVESRGWEKRVAARTYAYGDEPPAGASLAGPDGKPRTAVGPFRPGDAPGLWEARLPDGSSFAFLLLGKPPGAHPRVIDLAELRSRVKMPEFASAWKQVQDRASRSRREGALPVWAGENLLRLYPDRLLPGLYSYLSVLSRTANLAVSNALVGVLEDNQEAREAARKALLTAAAWPTWTPPWFAAHGMHTYYEAGIFTRNIALAYDLLYPALSDGERTAVRRALRDLGMLPIFREHFQDARMPFATSNWIANTVAGGIVALAVTDGEDGGADQPGLLTGLLARMREHVNETILADGSSGEPLSYEDFDLEGVSWTMGALQRAYGIDFQQGTALGTAHLYAVYDQTSAHECPDMGDGSLHGTRGFAWLARRNEDARLRRLYRGMPHEPVGELVLGPPPGEGAEQSLPSSRFFDRKGAIVLRANWDQDATVFALRAGPNYNHNHMDAGGFLLSSRGQALLSEAGVSHYYNDPHYGTFFIQAAGHNVMLVDGNPESQRLPDFLWVKALDRRPRWGTVLLADAADLFETELRAVYKAALESYRRTVLYVRPGYFVLCDRVAAPEPHAFSWLFHAPSGGAKLRLEPGGFAIERSAASLQARLVSTAALSLSEHERPAPVGSLENLAARKLEKLEYVQASAPSGRSAALVAVMCPTAPGDAAPAVEQIRVPGAVAVRVGDSDTIAFKTGSTGFAAGDVRSDADSVFVRGSSAGAERLAADKATRVSWRGRELLSASAPVSVSITWQAGSPRGTISASRATEVTLNGTRINAQAGETVLPER